MKTWPILAVAIEREADIVPVRQRARRIAELLGFDTQDQTRIATATSEIARNAHLYGAGGRVEFSLRGRRSPEAFAVRVLDRGPGFADLSAVLEGRFESRHGLGLGIAGARRLMDSFAVEAQPGFGAVVVLTKTLPKRGASVTAGELADIARTLTQEAAGDPMAELWAQNQELLRSLEAQEARRIEATHLSDELERTNKGVVALYAELDRRATELQELNATLEQRVAEGIAERERILESLRQSQKMEAVGQLTGGIAHDFNNLLMIIGGSLEMLRRRVPAEPALTRLIDAAAEGVARGGTLNQQLLAFARRQDLRVEIIAVRDFAPSCRRLIERAIREDITIRVASDGGDWHCRADPHQLETAVLNLAINARDAMPRGGVLTLSTNCRAIDDDEAARYQIAAGDYVVVSVGDTGTGMTPEVLGRAFEPFFTTKEVGNGTGLGLSQVYGFAKQSGGFVSIDSEAGRGTCVMIHLPRTEPAAEEVPHPAPVARIEGTATVLVVEDDPAVRATASAMLADLGYRTIEADTGRLALECVARGGVDLVFSDVILPEGMSGVDLAREVEKIAPDLPVLLTSGYTAQRLNLSPGARLRVLGKPYDEARLSEAVVQALRQGRCAR
jgi:signal transduction histidine kinase